MRAEREANMKRYEKKADKKDQVRKTPGMGKKHEIFMKKKCGVLRKQNEESMVIIFWYCYLSFSKC